MQRRRTPTKRELQARQQALARAAICLDDVTEQQVHWLWPGYLARGMVTLLDGDPGLGKSFLTLDLAARLTRGAGMPGQEATSSAHQGPADILLLNAEDDPARTLRPRLTALGADLKRCHTLTEIPEGAMTRPVSLPEDLPVLEQHLRQHQAALLVIDPLMAFLTPRMNTNHDSDVRRVLYGLKKLAEETQAAVLLVRHLNKNHAGKNPLYRGGGSIGIIGAARVAWLVGYHPQDEGLRVLCRLKGNLGTHPPSLAYSIEPTGGALTLHWHGEAPFGPRDLLRQEVPRGRPPEALDQALDFLRMALSHGPQPAAELETLATYSDISPATLRRAREQLEVISLPPTTRGGPWKWQLPGEQKECRKKR